MLPDSPARRAVWSEARAALRARPPGQAEGCALTLLAAAAVAHVLPGGRLLAAALLLGGILLVGGLYLERAEAAAHAAQPGQWSMPCTPCTPAPPAVQAAAQATGRASALAHAFLDRLHADARAIDVACGRAEERLRDQGRLRSRLAQLRRRARTVQSLKLAIRVLRSESANVGLPLPPPLTPHPATPSLMSCGSA
jgi:hypothetical protein